VSYPVLYGMESDDDSAKYEVMAAHPSHGKKRVPVARGPNAEVTVTFDQAAWLLVTVDGMDAHPAKDRIVAGGKLSGEEYWGNWNAITAVNGVFRMGPLQPSEFEVTLSLRVTEDYWSNLELAKATITLSPGDNHYRFSLPALYGLTVSVAGAPEGSSVGLHRNHKDSYEDESGMRHEYMNSTSAGSSMLDRSGTARFEYLPAGEYVIYVSPAASSSQQYDAVTVTLPGAGTVNIVPK
jgi:hypothetical protein